MIKKNNRRKDKHSKKTILFPGPRPNDGLNQSACAISITNKFRWKTQSKTAQRNGGKVVANETKWSNKCRRWAKIQSRDWMRKRRMDIVKWSRLWMSNRTETNRLNSNRKHLNGKSISWPLLLPWHAVRHSETLNQMRYHETELTKYPKAHPEFILSSCSHHLSVCANCKRSERGESRKSVLLYTHYYSNDCCQWWDNDDEDAALVLKSGQSHH